MTKLERFIRKNFNLTTADELHLPTILADMQAELEAGDYDDYFGRIPESTLFEVFDEKLATLLDTVA